MRRAALCCTYRDSLPVGLLHFMAFTPVYRQCLSLPRAWSLSSPPCSQQKHFSAFVHLLLEVLPSDLTAAGEQPDLAEQWDGAEGGTGWVQSLPRCVWSYKKVITECAKQNTLPGAITSVAARQHLPLREFSRGFSRGLCRTDMNLLTHKFTRCINQFRDH